jgi:hypothetical protein
VLDHLIAANDENLLETDLLERGRAHIPRTIQLLNGYMNYLKRAHSEGDRGRGDAKFRAGEIARS